MNKQIIFSLLLIANITTYGMHKQTRQSSNEAKQQTMSLSNNAQKRIFSTLIETNKDNTDFNGGLEAINTIIENSRFTKAQGPYSELPQSRLFVIRETYYKNRLSKL
jgi:hypothetical protein